MQTNGQQKIQIVFIMISNKAHESAWHIGRGIYGELAGGSFRA